MLRCVAVRRANVKTVRLGAGAYTGHPGVVMGALRGDAARAFEWVVGGSLLAAGGGGPFTAELIVEESLSGLRIDHFLVRHLRNYTTFRMQRMIRAGHAWVHGVAAGPGQRVYRGERVTIRLVEGPDKLIVPEPLPVDILFEDAWLVAVNKPPGQVAHPVCGFQSGTTSAALQFHFNRQTRLRGLLRPGIVHRLDRMTSGVLVVTKEHAAHRGLSRQFQQGRVAKVYRAVVEGVVGENEGRIDLPIGRRPGGRSILMSVAPDARDPRPAETRFVVLKRLAGRTLVEARPLTGRNHQIRIHLAAIGHPVVGDEFYGPYGTLRAGSETPMVRAAQFQGQSTGPAKPHDPADNPPRHLLHAQRIDFVHPVTGERLSIEAPLPGDMTAELRRSRENARRVSATAV